MACGRAASVAKNLRKDCESAYAQMLRSVAAQMWSAAAEILRRHVNTFETIYEDISR